MHNLIKVQTVGGKKITIQLAGNLTILGAASNIIIIDVAESKNVKTFTFFEFFKIGVLVALTNIVIYYLFIT
ncbi:MAG: hypothetical protein WBF33_15925 [Candidatus Nitrosopolaris sp.]